MTVAEVLDILSLVFPSPKSELNYNNEFELLIAVILSAQTTDISVNKVTPDLFVAYPNPYSLSKMEKGPLPNTIIRQVSFYCKGQKEYL